MKLISIEMGRVALPFVADEVRPIKGLYIAEVNRLISERYGFGVIPTVPESITSGAKFQQGRLVAGNRTLNIADFSYFNDGLAITTSLSTDDADFVFEDFWEWSKQAIGRREPITKKAKIFESHLVVEFDFPVDTGIQIFAEVRTELRQSFKEVYNQDHPVEFNRITFSIDPLRALPTLQGIRAELWLERRAGISFSENRYFSACGLTTDKHLHLLETFEGAVKEKE